MAECLVLIQQKDRHKDVSYGNDSEYELECFAVFDHFFHTPFLAKKLTMSNWSHRVDLCDYLFIISQIDKNVNGKCW